MKWFIKWSTEILLFGVRALIFWLLFYIPAVFVFLSGAVTFQNMHSLWQFMLMLSVYLAVTMVIFYYLGRLFALGRKTGWSVYSDGFLSLAVLSWGVWIVLSTDIAKMLSQFLWTLTVGWAMPVYYAADRMFGENINYYKYIFIMFWALVAVALFFGMRQKHIKQPRRKKVTLAAAALVFVMVLSFNVSAIIWVCTPRMFSEQTYPAVDGATASIPFGQVLARELLGKDAFQAQKYVDFNTTHNAYVNLIEKRADIIFAAEPSVEELALAESNGVKLKLTPIGMDAFVFIVNNKNPVQGLTIEQIRQIYTGEITNWKELGAGTDKEIIAYQRSQNSGSQTIMENVVMKGLVMMDAPTEEKPDAMGGMIEAVADYENAQNAIGYTVYYYANEMNKNENIKFLAVNGVECSKENIRAKTYPFAGPLYAITRENDESENTVRLLEFIVSSKGQKLVEKGGFVAIG